MNSSGLALTTRIPHSSNRHRLQTLIFELQFLSTRDHPAEDDPRDWGLRLPQSELRIRFCSPDGYGVQNRCLRDWCICVASTLRYLARSWRACGEGDVDNISSWMFHMILCECKRYKSNSIEHEILDISKAHQLSEPLHHGHSHKHRPVAVQYQGSLELRFMSDHPVSPIETPVPRCRDFSQLLQRQRGRLAPSCNIRRKARNLSTATRLSQGHDSRCLWRRRQIHP